jgi:hypothetical protein
MNSQYLIIQYEFYIQDVGTTVMVNYLFFLLFVNIAITI